MLVLRVGLCVVWVCWFGRRRFWREKYGDAGRERDIFPPSRQIFCCDAGFISIKAAGGMYKGIEGIAG